MTYENEKIPDLSASQRDDATYDQVVGARTTEEGTHKWARVPAKWFIRKVAEWLTKTKIPDLNSGLRASAAGGALPTCGCSGWLLVRHDDHDRLPCPTSTTSSTSRPPTWRAGTSKFHFVSRCLPLHPPGAADGHVLRPLKVLMPPAVWLILLGVVKGVVDMVRHPSTSPANTVLLVVSGVMIGSLALLSDLVVRSRRCLTTSSAGGISSPAALKIAVVGPAIPTRVAWRPHT